MRSRPADLSTRARIRDGAIRRFAADGLDVPLRAIGADVDVSPGLILHHFGSRAGLREACDAHVLELVRDNKTGVLASNGGPGILLAQLSQLEGYAPAVGYTLRVLQVGGTLAKHFVDGIVADAVVYLAEGVTAGTVSPSRDPQARARMLAEMSLGSLLLQLPSPKAKLDLEELPGWVAQYMDRITLPFLEMFTEPLLTDASLLDAYLATTDRSTA